MSDLVKSPNHYKQMACVIEPIEVTYAMHSCLGQVLQYILRYQLKGNPVQDLQKAKFGLEWFLDRYFSDVGNTAVRTMATDDPFDDAIRASFQGLFTSPDKTITMAVTHLLQESVSSEDIAVLIDQLSWRITELEASQ